jgi:hypothetical protein
MCDDLLGEDDLSGPLKNTRTTDLKPLVSEPHPSGPLYGLGNGHQSIILAVVRIG